MLFCESLPTFALFHGPACPPAKSCGSQVQPRTQVLQRGKSYEIHEILHPQYVAVFTNTCTKVPWGVGPFSVARRAAVLSLERTPRYAGLITPLQSFCISSRAIPRALPWAGILRPSGLEEKVGRIAIGRQRKQVTFGSPCKGRLTPKFPGKNA